MHAYGRMNAICSYQQSPFQRGGFPFKFQILQKCDRYVFHRWSIGVLSKGRCVQWVPTAFHKVWLGNVSNELKIVATVSCLASARFGPDFLPYFGIKSVIFGLRADVRQHLMQPEVNEYTYGWGLQVYTNALRLVSKLWKGTLIWCNVSPRQRPAIPPPAIRTLVMVYRCSWLVLPS